MQEYSFWPQQELAFDAVLKAVLAGAEFVKIRKALLSCVGHLREARAGKTRSIGLAAKMRPEA